MARLARADLFEPPEGSVFHCISTGLRASQSPSPARQADGGLHRVPGQLAWPERRLASWRNTPHPLLAPGQLAWPERRLAGWRRRLQRT
jgi:hypothetical protein